MGVGRQVVAAETTAPVGGYSTVTFEGLRHAGANIGLATMFFVAAIPGGGGYHLNHLGDAIWSFGMILTGVFCLMRPRPMAVMLDWRAMLSGFGAFALPALMWRNNFSTAGFTYQTAIVLETLGVTLSQGARIYMGQAFAVLPANRGIVSNGPFRFVRHPVYLGWLLLAMGFSMAYPSFWNVAIFGACMVLTLWRIHLEEELLSDDPEYREYLSHVHYRMIPGVY
jgi:protein-S-isoprenylcysteine O-methyltransferase Ste14